MANVIEKTGKTVDEAIQAALDELGVSAEQVDIEVLELPTKRLFGWLGETPAKVRATLKAVAVPVEEKSTAVAESAPVADETVAEVIEPILEPSPADENFKAEAVDKAKTFLRDVFDAMKLDIEIDVNETDDGYLFDLSGKGLGILIGRHGQALDSLQYLLNLAANRRDAENKIHFTLDIEGYRARRADALEKLAKNMAERAIKTRKDVRLEPMNRHERKMIHTALQDNNRVETHSAGTEPYRYVIITPTKRPRR